LIKLLEGESFFSRCGFGLNECSDGHPCPMHDEYHKIRQNYYEVVSRLSIYEMAVKLGQDKVYLHDKI